MGAFLHRDGGVPAGVLRRCYKARGWKVSHCLPTTSRAVITTPSLDGPVQGAPPAGAERSSADWPLRRSCRFTAPQRSGSGAHFDPPWPKRASSGNLTAFSTCGAADRADPGRHASRRAPRRRATCRASLRAPRRAAKEWRRDLRRGVFDGAGPARCPASMRGGALRGREAADPYAAVLPRRVFRHSDARLRRFRTEWRGRHVRLCLRRMFWLSCSCAGRPRRAGGRRAGTGLRRPGPARHMLGSTRRRRASGSRPARSRRSGRGEPGRIGPAGRDRGRDTPPKRTGRNTKGQQP